jgi:hypothetical protein
LHIRGMVRQCNASPSIHDHRYSLREKVER